MRRVLLDTNVFIFSIEHPKSNSNIIIEMAIDGEIEVVISAEIRLEFIEYLKSEHGKDAAYHADMFLKSLPNIEIVEQRRIKSHINKLRGKIKEKDLPHLASAEISRVECVVSYDRDFKKAKTRIPVLTPKEFIEKLGIEPFESGY
ncbi:MAG: PIN domain-containing protein [Euryarchaeota archaeon]|nr:PIN domain-containing protein [Euryarchaeota archaeon]